MTAVPQAIADRALDVVVRKFGEELKLPAGDAALVPAEPLVSERLGFSSFSFVRAVIAIEDEVEVELADDVFDTVHRCGTIGDVITVVIQALGR